MRLQLCWPLIICGVFLFGLPVQAGPQRILSPMQDPIYALGREVAHHALQKLAKPKGENLLVLTNAGYVKVNDADTSIALDAITEVTGCSAGKGNLLTVQAATGQPLYFFFFAPSNGNAFYAELEPKPVFGPNRFRAGLSEGRDRLFKRVDWRNIGRAEIFANPERIEKDIQSGLFGNRGNALIGIAHLWMQDPPPLELIRTVQFHDHVCPGVLSGYYISRFLSSQFPLGPEQRYFFIASPSYCKDDALQIIFNQTVGKRGMAAMFLSPEDRACLPPEAQEAAGIFFRYDPKSRKGNGAVIGFAWDRLREDTGLQRENRFPFLDSLKQILWMIERREQFERYVYFIKTFDLPPGEVPQEYGRVGVNPWEKLGLWAKKRDEQKP